MLKRKVELNGIQAYGSHCKEESVNKPNFSH